METTAIVISAISAVAAIAIAVIAWYQIDALRKQQRKWSTLEVCNRYDTDPILVEAHRTLRKHVDGKEIDQEALAESSLTLLNYFDAIFIGVKQKLYIKEIVKEHLWPIIKGHVQWTKESENPELVERNKMLPESFPNMMEYHDKWTDGTAKDFNWKYVGVVALAIGAVVLIGGLGGLIVNLSE